jgi:hypothetical protein
MKEQECFNPEDAAKRLCISPGELSYQVKEGGIRLAVEIPSFFNKRIVYCESLGQINKGLCSVVDTYMLAKNWEAHRGGYARVAPRFLYLNVSRAVIRWTEEPPHEFKSMIFETFEGKSVVLLDLEGFPEFVYLGSRTTEGFYSDSVITLEEIDRTNVSSDTELVPESEETPPVLSSSLQLEVFESDRPNAVTEILCFYANKYVSERQEIPTFTPLFSYMLKESQSDYLRKIQVDPKREKSVHIGGQWISETSLKRRFTRLERRKLAD